MVSHFSIPLDIGLISKLGALALLNINKLNLFHYIRTNCMTVLWHRQLSPRILAKTEKFLFFSF